MSKKGITSSLNVVELESKITKVLGNFNYVNYESDERKSVDEDLNGVLEDGHVPNRWVSIKIKSTYESDTGLSDTARAFISTIQAVLESSDSVVLSQVQREDSDGVYLPNTFFTQDFIHGFVRIVPNSTFAKQSFNKVTQNAVNSQYGVRTTLDYLKKNTKGSEYIDINLDQYEKALKGFGDSNLDLFVLDPNTNLPTSVTEQGGDSYSEDSYISSYYIDKILKRSKQSPVIRDIADRLSSLGELITKQNASLKNSRKLSNMNWVLNNTDNAGNRIDFVVTPSFGTPLETIAENEVLYEHIGWHVLKYVKEGENYVFKTSFFSSVDRSTETHESYPGASDIEENASENYHVIKDPYVLYGKQYRYEIRDAFGVFKESEESNGRTGFVLLGTQTVPIEVDCVEKLPPLCPTGFSFEYVGDDLIRIGWQKNPKLIVPTHRWDQENIPEDVNGDPVPLEEYEADDIGGYLLFIRNSLESPYTLYSQFHRRDPLGNDTARIGTEIQPTVIGVSVPNDKVSYINEDVQQFYNLSIRSNLDYYIAFCSYDVHGNISTYSEQFYVRRNNVTGEVATQIVSSKGASLAYPNELVPNKFVLSSMVSSGYKYMEVFQTPDIQGKSVPSDGGITIQLIDLETEADVLVRGVSP